jgi:hypothetical protein
LKVDGGDRYRLIEIQILNSSDASVFDLSLLLRGKGAKHLDLPFEFVSSNWTGSYGRWTLAEGAVVPPGSSTLNVFIRDDQFGLFIPIWRNVAIGFTDRNGRLWTRRLDGLLIEGWRM